MNQSKSLSDAHIENPSALLEKMVREDSSHEMDWLWASQQVINPDERRYCLARALYINPDNLETLALLQALTPAAEPAPNGLFGKIHALFSKLEGTDNNSWSQPASSATMVVMPKIGR